MTRSGGTPDWFLAPIAYDALAERYDRVPVENRINAYMRRVSLSRLLETFPEGSRLLELGCGTAEETVALALRGRFVVALEPSPQMIAVAKEKAQKADVEGRAEFVRGSARELRQLRDALRPPFDGGYASFSLSYEPELAPVFAALHEVLRPGALFMASLPSRVCLVELLLALGTARPSYAGRRLRPWYGHKVGTSEVPIRSYTVRDIRSQAAPFFHLGSVEAITSLIPPPYMNRLYARAEGVADAIERVDNLVRRHAPFREIGDHILVSLVHESREN